MSSRSINAMARLQNSYAGAPDDPLIGLVNPTTGRVIANMPADSEALSHMTGTPLQLRFFIPNYDLATQIRPILVELGQIIPQNQAGGLPQLRRLLRVQLGLRGDRESVA